MARASASAKRIADSSSMAAHEVYLQFGKLVPRYSHIRQLAESRVYAVYRFACRKDSLNQSAALGHSPKAVGATWTRRPLRATASTSLELQRLSVQNQFVHRCDGRRFTRNMKEPIHHIHPDITDE